MSHDRRRAYRHGLAAELIAALLLLAQGYRLLARRYRTPLGEIDLIARRGHTIVFVEVKARRTLEDALHAVDRASERRIAAAADLWVANHPDATGFDQRFDIILILPRRFPRQIRNAFPGG